MSTERFLRELRDREYDQYIVDVRGQRLDSYKDWKTRITDADNIVAGEFSMVYPNQIKATEQPMVQNTAETMVRDVARLVSDAQPTVRSFSKGETDAAFAAQQVREAIADTYWAVNEGELLVPLWTMDLLVTGSAFAVAWVDDESDYPKFERIDPRFCYPDVYNGKLIDLLVIQRMKVRQVAALFPQLGLTDDPTSKMEAEIIDYYGHDKVIKAVTVMKKGEAPTASSTYFVSGYENKLGCVPVAFAQLPSHDGAFRGMLDQSGPSILAKNKIVKLMTRYAEQQIAAPFKAKGVININDKPGPNVIYQLDPNIPDADMDRVQPAGGSPQLFALLQYLGEEQRNQLAYPQSRQGDVSQSIASAAFVASTQGNLSSVVRDVQKYLGKMRSHLTEVCFKFDEQEKDYEKPLVVHLPAGRKNRYLPSEAIDGIYKTKVTYGAGAGLDRLNTDVRLIQLYGAGFIDADTARENIEFVQDPSTVADKWDKEQVRKALLQRFVGDPNAPFDLVMRVFELQQDGKSFSEAVSIARQEAAEAAEQQLQAAPEAGAVPAGPAAQVPEGAVEAGATAPDQLGGSGEVVFNPPPLEQIFVNPGRAA